MLPANLPDISSAKIPAIYQAAKTAISECARIDECKDWADKAEALASYAKQADDDSMRKMADRIQARATRRCGELLREIAPRDSAGPPVRNCTGADTITRTAAARDAGMSKRQKVTALRISAISEQEFEDAVESTDPPTVTALAERGKKPSTAHLRGIAPEDFKISTHGQAQIRRLAEYAAKTDPQTVFRGAYEKERISLMNDVRSCLAWLKGVHE